MGAPLGRPKPEGSGRKAGSGNKRKTIDVAAILEERDVDLIDLLLTDIEQVTDPRKRAGLRLQLLEYVAPRRKAIEMSGELGMGVPITEDNVDDVYQRARKRALRLAGGADIG